MPYINSTASLDFYNEQGKEWIEKEKARFIAETLGTPFWYLTFPKDGFKNKKILLVIRDPAPGFMEVHAQAENMQEALLWVKTNNPHLKYDSLFPDGHYFDNYTGDQDTVKINFEYLPVR